MRRWPSTLALALMIPLVACERSPVAVEEPADVSGTYQLKTVNTEPVPFIVATQGEAWLEITSGYLELRDDGRFLDVLILRVKENGETLDEGEDRVEGTWSESGGTVTLMLDVGGSSPAIVLGDTLTQVVNQAYTLQYVRE